MILHPTVLPAHALVRFIAGMTGLHLAFITAPAPGRAWDLRRLIAGCRAHARRTHGARRALGCEPCLRGHLRGALAAPCRGHELLGPCGVRSFLLPVTGITGPVGIMALRRGSAGGRHRPRGGAIPNDRRDSDFLQAVKLLRPMAQRSAWGVGGIGLRRRPRATGRLAPRAVERPTHGAEAPGSEPRSVREVRALIDRVRREYAAPLGLKQLAQESGLNPSYLSTVFAREAGLPFKPFLTAVRLERAQTLLRDTCLPISRVAREAGFATPHGFRAAFRMWTGISPGCWRMAQRLDGGG